MVKHTTITLKSVNESDCPFLYEILSERDPRANISHRKMPSYDEHVKFVISKPYAKWYIIVHKNEKIGSTYLTRQNEIGIFIKKAFHNKGLGKKAIHLLMKKNPRDRYLANVNPKNIKSARFFKKNGFLLIQHTYELRVTEI